VLPTSAEGATNVKAGRPTFGRREEGPLDAGENAGGCEREPAAVAEGTPNEKEGGGNLEPADDAGCGEPPPASRLPNEKVELELAAAGEQKSKFGWDTLLFSAEVVPNEKAGCTSAMGPPNEKAGWGELEPAIAGVPNSNTGRGALEEGAPNWKTGCGKPSTEADAEIEAGVGGLLVAASAPSE